VTTYHSYEIAYRYRYRCVACGRLSADAPALGRERGEVVRVLSPSTASSGRQHRVCCSEGPGRVRMPNGPSRHYRRLLRLSRVQRHSKLARFECACGQGVFVQLDPPAATTIAGASGPATPAATPRRPNAFTEFVKV